MGELNRCMRVLLADHERERDDRARAQAALESLLAAPPVPVGTPEELKRELAEAWDEEIKLDCS